MLNVFCVLCCLFNGAARGEAGDDDDTFEVDFLSKSYEHHQQQQPGNGDFPYLSIHDGDEAPGEYVLVYVCLCGSVTACCACEWGCLVSCSWLQSLLI